MCTTIHSLGMRVLGCDQPGHPGNEMPTNLAGGHAAWVNSGQLSLILYGSVNGDVCRNGSHGRTLNGGGEREEGYSVHIGSKSV